MKRLEKLSPRQEEIVKLAAHMGYMRIARRLGIGYDTVRSHVKAIVRKVGRPGETPQDVMARYRDEQLAA